MATKKISELTAAASLSGTNLFEVSQGANSRKATLTQIIDAAKATYDTLYVGLTGTQTVAGAKTFSSLATFSAGLAIAAAQILTAPTVGPDTDSQHVLPDVAADTFALLAASQTFTNKTLTSPKINVGSDAHGDVYFRNASGDFVRLAPGTDNYVLTTHGVDADPTWEPQTGGGGDVFLAGAQTFTGTKTFGAGLIVTAGQNLLAATIGPDADSQHALPDVAADTVALLAATQTFTNKTVSGGTFSGTIAGTPTYSGAATFTAAPTVAVDDATTNAATTLLTLTHTTSGTPAAGLAGQILFTAEDAAGNAEELGAIDAVLVTATDASEAAGFDFLTRTGGAAKSRKFRITPTGTLMVGGLSATAIAAEPTSGVLCLANNKFIYGRNAADSAFISLLAVNASNQVTIGGATTNPIVTNASTITLTASSGSVTANASTTVLLQTSGTTYGRNSSTTTWIWGTGEAGTPGAFTVRGADASGTNIAGAVLTIRAGLGTGNAAANYLSLGGSISTTSGTGAHTAGESARAYGQYFQHTAGVVHAVASVKTGTYTSLITDHYIPVNTAGGAFTVTLVTAPPDGFVQEFKDQTGNCLTNNLTIARGGSDTIENGTVTSATSITIATNFGTVRLRYNAGVWYRLGTL